MNEPAARTVLGEVVHVEDVTKRWKRIVIDTKEAYPRLAEHFGRDLQGNIAGAYQMHFLLPVTGDDAARFPRLSGPFVERFFNVDPGLYGDPAVEFVTRRSYTVRPVDGDVHQLELNIVLQGDGIGRRWAEAVEPGKGLLLDLGGRVLDIDELPVVGTYLLMGDESSVPTIATMVPRLPSTSAVFVCLEVDGSEDEWTFETRGHEQIEWLRRGDQTPGTTDFLIDRCKRFAWPTGGDVHVWAAAEGRQVYALRDHLRNAVGLQRGQYELMGYWRRGVSTEQMLEVEATTINARLAAGLSPMDRPTDADQARKTPYEMFQVD